MHESTRVDQGPGDGGNGDEQEPQCFLAEATPQEHEERRAALVQAACHGVAAEEPGSAVTLASLLGVRMMEPVVRAVTGHIA